jgi:uncharacterized membrane protein YkvI
MSSGKLFFQRYILVGLMFQSVIIAGGYATGRELVEFFLSYGPAAGLAGMLLATLIVSTVLPIGFELARITRSYDYRSFVRQFLGRWWLLFELGYAAGIVMVLAVIASGVGTVAGERLGVAEHVASMSFMALVALIVYFGSGLIEKILSFWSLLLYAAYGALFYMVMSHYGGDIASNATAGGIDASALKSGALYSNLQLSMIPAVLFATVHFTRRRHAVVSGILAGPITMIPGFLMFFAMVAFYPVVAEQPVPMAYMMAQLDTPVLATVIQLIILGTFVETGAAMVHSVNERVAAVLKEKNRDIKPLTRAMLAIGIMVFCVYLATAVGIVDLIGKGYTFMTWYFTVFFLLPLITIGLWKVVRHHSEATP